MKDYAFTVVIERDEDGRFVAVCPALPGCFTEGETLEEAKLNIADAIKLNLEDRLAAGEAIGEEVDVVRITVAA